MSIMMIGDKRPVGEELGEINHFVDVQSPMVSNHVQRSFTISAVFS